MIEHEVGVPLTWVIGIFFTFAGLWMPVVFALVSQARSFGAMGAKLDAALKEVEEIRSLEGRISILEGWVERLRERFHNLANQVTPLPPNKARKP